MRTLTTSPGGHGPRVPADAEAATDVSIITAAKELAPELPVYSVVTDEDFLEYHERAGAERAFLPRKLLGNGLANKVRNTVETSVEGGLSVGEDIEIAEVPVASKSELDGTYLTEDGIVDSGEPDDRNRTPYHVIGVWARGQFHVPPFERVALDEQTVLLVAGRSVTVAALARSAGSQISQYGRGRVLVAGSGVVGTMVSDALLEDGIAQTVIDIEQKGRVDAVGDVTEEETFEDHTLGEADLRERFGCSVVAIERRDGRVDADLREWTEIAAGDRLFVAGTDAALDRLDTVLSPADSGSRGS